MIFDICCDKHLAQLHFVQMLKGKQRRRQKNVQGEANRNPEKIAPISLPSLYQWRA